MSCAFNLAIYVLYIPQLQHLPGEFIFMAQYCFAVVTITISCAAVLFRKVDYYYYVTACLCLYYDGKYVVSDIIIISYKYPCRLINY